MHVRRCVYGFHALITTLGELGEKLQPVKVVPINDHIFFIIVPSAANRTDSVDGTPSASVISAPCSPPAIESFPSPLIGAEARARGAVAVHLAIAASMCVAIFVLCKDYFNPTADIIIGRLGMDPEVANGTFIAAAGSLPSLIASIAGINGAQTDLVLVNSLGSGVLKAAGVLAVARLVSPAVVSVVPLLGSSDCVHNAG